MPSLLLFNFCVCGGDVTWEVRCVIITVKCFAGGVLPGAGKVIICANEFEVWAGGDGC